MSVTQLGTLTIGQAPRSDITPILDAYLPDGTRCIHAGVLDGLSKEQIAQRFTPQSDESVLTSRLLDGSAVVLSKQRVQTEVQHKLKLLEQQGCEVILLLCTGEFQSLSCQHAWLIEPDRVVPATAARLAGSHQCGILVPLASQMETEGEKWSDMQKPPLYAAVSPYSGSENDLIAAAQSLQARQARMIIMDCMGYTDWHRERVRAATGLPVLLSNAVIARLTASLL